MYTATAVLAAIVAVPALAQDYSQPAQVTVTYIETVSGNVVAPTSQGAAGGQASAPASIISAPASIVSAPASVISTPAYGNSEPVQTTGPMTVNVENRMGRPLSMFVASNEGCPTASGNPASTTLASSTQFVFPTDWAGRVTLGNNYDPAGSKIEASLSGPNYLPDIDVSYVDGYTVPITCSCAGIPVTGCNLQLWNQTSSCTSKGPGPVCYNGQAQVPDGPASPFFAPCAGAAYTYPNDNDANVGCQEHTVNCCVGTSCDAPPRQKNFGSYGKVRRHLHSHAHAHAHHHS